MNNKLYGLIIVSIITLIIFLIIILSNNDGIVDIELDKKNVKQNNGSIHSIKSEMNGNIKEIIPIINNDQDKETDCEIKASCERVTGIVIDNTNNNTIECAKISIYYNNIMGELVNNNDNKLINNYDKLFDVSTDENGKFSFVISMQIQVRLLVEKEGYAQEDVFYVKNGDKLKIKLKNIIPISGFIKWPNNIKDPSGFLVILEEINRLKTGRIWKKHYKNNEQFEFSKCGSGFYYIQAFCDKYPKTSKVKVDNCIGKTDNICLIFSNSNVFLCGTIIDEITNIPIENVQINVNWEKYNRAFSDINGDFKLLIDSKCKKNRVRFEADGYISRNYEIPFETDNKNIKIYLKRGIKVFGKYLDKNGNPIEGAKAIISGISLQTRILIYIIHKFFNCYIFISNIIPDLPSAL